jgi:DNA helicase-2/ATP-dependent DNA helicase PcrA
MDLSMLNPEQIDAVLHTDGPCCVVAGAGSGKTRVLTYRVANLLELGVPARSVLAVTFTKKAAGEMQERLAELIGNAALEDLSVGTFHSICYSILRNEWRAADGRFFEPAQEGWCRRTIKDILDPKNMNWALDVGAALSFISWQKNNLIAPDDKLDMQEMEPFLEEKLRELYRRYEDAKDAEGKLDFDDMLLWCYRLLRDNPSVRRRYQAQWQHVMVDEFQDTNLAQYEILKLLAASNNIFVVGDARQAIYGWRAARVEFILNFKREWPGARVIVLKTNYRSSSNIVEMSNRLINSGSVAYPGECRANQGTLLEPICCSSDDEDGEAEFIANEIQALLREGFQYRDFSCLYRVNAQSRALEDSLIKNQIPYVVLGALGFYNRKEVKDIVAYLRILADPNDEEAIARVLNVPTRYLGKAFLQGARTYAQAQQVPLLEAVECCHNARLYKYRGVNDFLFCVKKLRRLDCTPAELTIHARKITGYDQWLAESEGVEDGADNPRVENLNALAAAAARFSKLEEFLFYVEQAQAKPSDPDTRGNRVQLMTLHRSKGLEFPVVFMAGMVQGLLPHQRSCVYEDGELVPESVEEERRLCYVGMTRAKKRLYLSAMAMYQSKAVEKSMFLGEIGDGLATAAPSDCENAEAITR